MQGRVSVSGIRIEALTNHEHRLFMLISPRFCEGDIGRHRNIVRDFLPHKVKRVPRKPHVLPAAGHPVGLAGRVVFERTGMKHIADVDVAFEYASRRRRGLGPGQTRRTSN